MTAALRLSVFPAKDLPVTVVADGDAENVASICGAASSSVRAVNAPKTPASTSQRLGILRNPCIFTVETSPPA
jgi:hypothetical protein